MTYSARLLTADDAVLLDDFLKPHTVEAFFLRSNALQAGLVYEGKALQGNYIGAFRDKALVGVVCYTWLKTILLFFEDLGSMPCVLPLLHRALASHDGVLDAVLGLKNQADRLTDLLGIKPEDYRQDVQDWLFRLDVARLRRPEALKNKGFVIRRAQDRDAPQLISWRIAFNVEACAATPDEKLAQDVHAEITRKIAQKELFVLEKEGHLLSFAGISGSKETIDDTIIIGSVWTPPDYRGQGFAKMATAGMIDFLAQEWGTLTQAILFASRPDAIGAYKAIGFEIFGDWRLAFLRDGYKIAPHPLTCDGCVCGGSVNKEA